MKRMNLKMTPRWSIDMTNPITTISRELLIEYVHYDHYTGIFRSIKNRSGGPPEGSVLGTLDSEGYRRITFFGKRYSAARLAFFYMENRWPVQIDHTNRVRDDDRWVNLREASSQENMCNRNIQSNNKSGYKGVSWNKATCKWVSYVKINRKQISLGLYDDLELAALVSEQAREKYHGDFAV